MGLIWNLSIYCFNKTIESPIQLQCVMKQTIRKLNSLKFWIKQRRIKAGLKRPWEIIIVTRQRNTFVFYQHYFQFKSLSCTDRTSLLAYQKPFPDKRLYRFFIGLREHECLALLTYSSRTIPINLDVFRYGLPMSESKVMLASRLIEDLQSQDDLKLLQSLIRNLIKSQPNFRKVRLRIFNSKKF